MTTSLQGFRLSKPIAFLLILVVTPLIGGLYGIIHDQLTYSISPEYYTKFKFFQFRLAHEGNEAIFPYPRLQVSMVGFMATWWTGIPIGLVLGLVGLTHAEGKQMFRVTLKAIILTIAVAFVTGLAGLALGKFYLADSGVSWNLPGNLVDKENFVTVGSMHNFSYLGGLIGLLSASFYSAGQKKKGSQGTRSPQTDFSAK